MRKLARHLGLFLDVGRFDHQRVRIAAGLQDIVSAAGVSHDDQLDAPLQRTQHIVRLDAPAIGQFEGDLALVAESPGIAANALPHAASVAEIEAAEAVPYRAAAFPGEKSDGHVAAPMRVRLSTIW